MAWKLEYNPDGTQITDEQIVATGTVQQLAHDNVFDVEIWTGPNKTGTKLIEGTDYTLGNFDTFYKTYNSITFNSSYAGQTLYATYKTKGDYIEAADMNELYENKANKNLDNVEQTTLLEKLKDIDGYINPNWLPNKLGLKNYLINGNFLIWQRGTSFNTVGYTADRWRLEIAGNASATVTRTKSTTSNYSVLNSPYYATISFTAGTESNSYVVFGQFIEDVSQLANKKVTISFWAKSDVPVKLWTEIKQKFNIAGASQAGIGVAELNLTTEWKKYIVTVDIPQIPDANAIEDPTTSATILYFWLEAGPNFNSRIPGIQHQSGVVHIAEVQLEEGTYATSFEHRPYGLELMLCQRYYEKLPPYADTRYTQNTVNTFPFDTTFVFKTTKRVVPTISYTVSETSFSAVGVKEVTTQGFIFGALHNSTGAGPTSYIYVLDGFVADAEF